MIYYGAAADRPTMEAAFATEDVPLYSIGESADRRYWQSQQQMSLMALVLKE